MAQTVFTASNASWATPADWNNTDNSVEGIGGGGGGADNSSGNGSGGGGGEYRRANNVTLNAATNNNITVGAAGSGGTGSNNSTSGGFSGVQNSTPTTLMQANGGTGGQTTPTGGTGGTGAAGSANGGTGGGAGSWPGCGGAGAGGPNGIGGNGGGGASSSSGGGAGGGGAGGGGNGADGAKGDGAAAGGLGGTKFGGGGAGAAGTTAPTAGGDGSGGGGGGGGGTSGSTNAAGGNGSTEDGTTYTPSWGSSAFGSGGGAGAGSNGNTTTTGQAGKVGAVYGGGGSGGTGLAPQNGGAGAAGIVVVTWTPAGGPTVWQGTTVFADISSFLVNAVIISKWYGTTLLALAATLAANATKVLAPNNLRQKYFRFRTDAGTVDATPTWGADENTAYYPGTANFRLRVGVENSGSDPSGALPWQLYVDKNGGGYTPVTTSSLYARSVDAGSDADETAIYTRRLGLATDWWLAGSAIDLDFANSRYDDSGGDTDVVLLLHMDGADASTTFTDATGRHHVTPYGDAQIDTAQSKFGGASFASLSPSNLSLDNADDFVFGTGDFTIDFWYRMAAAGTGQFLYCSGAYPGTGPSIYKWTNDEIAYCIAGADKITYLGPLVIDQWYHFSVTRSGTSTRMFLDGVQVGSTYVGSDNLTSGIPQIPAEASSYARGWIDELRVIKGRAAWTEDFTPPASPHTAAVTGPYTCLSCFRASIGYAKTAVGTLTQFGTDELRITDLGLLVEDARTNEAHYSQDFTTWTMLIGGTVTPDDAIAPDGTQTADKFEHTANGIVLNSSIADIPSGQYTHSIYVKPNTGNSWIRLEIQKYFNLGRVGCWFNLSGSGTVGSNAADTIGTFINATIESLANGWFRLNLTGNFPSGVVGPAFYLRMFLDGDGSDTGDSSGSLWLWGAQSEIGSFASSYIPTTTVATTRAADVVTCIGNLNTILGSGSASAVMDVLCYGFSQSYAHFLRDSVSDYILVRNSVDTQIATGYSASTGTTIGGGLTLLTGCKIGVSYDSSGQAIVGGGGTVGTHAYDMSPINLPITSGYGVFGNIKRLTVWNTRLADATLQGLTAP